MGAGGVVSEGSKAHREAVLTKVEYGATRPGCWMMAEPVAARVQVLVDER